MNASAAALVKRLVELGCVDGLVEFRRVMDELFWYGKLSVPAMEYWIGTPTAVAGYPMYTEIEQ